MVCWLFFLFFIKSLRQLKTTEQRNSLQDTAQRNLFFVGSGQEHRHSNILNLETLLNMLTLLCLLQPFPPLSFWNILETMVPFRKAEYGKRKQVVWKQHLVGPKISSWSKDTAVTAAAAAELSGPLWLITVYNTKRNIKAITCVTFHTELQTILKVYDCKKC